jgi:KUP system potassium uptake protein
VFWIVELAFLGANLLKILEGGWFPIILGAAVFAYMSTWKRGREILTTILLKRHVPLAEFMKKIETERVHRSEGTGVYMSRDLTAAPLALINTVEHLRSAPKNLVFVSVEIKNTPRLSLDQRYVMKECSPGCYQVLISFGYLEKPDVPAVFEQIRETNDIFNKDDATFFIGRENIFATELPGMALWREKLFSFVFRNELPATQYFELPRHRVIEVGSQVEI